MQDVRLSVFIKNPNHTPSYWEREEYVYVAVEFYGQRFDSAVGFVIFGGGMERKFCTARFLRSDLQRGLLEHVDNGCLRLGKKVVGLQEVGEKVRVKFED